MDVTGGYIGIGILIAFAWFFIIFGGVEEDEPQKSKTLEHRLRKKD